MMTDIATGSCFKILFHSLINGNWCAGREFGWAMTATEVL